MIFKRLGLALLGLCLISGCTRPNAGYDVTERMEVDPDTIEDPGLVQAYKDYMETDLFKSFVTTADYGMTLYLKAEKQKPNFSFQNISNIIIESANKFNSITTPETIDMDSEYYDTLYKLVLLQQEVVDNFKTAAEEMIESTAEHPDYYESFHYFNAAENKLKDCYDFVDWYIN